MPVSPTITKTPTMATPTMAPVERPLLEPEVIGREVPDKVDAEDELAAPDDNCVEDDVREVVGFNVELFDLSMSG